jgi:tetratricopeptide (TPR) repeat protein
LGDINQAIFYLLKSVRLKPDAKVHTNFAAPSIAAFVRLTSIQVFVALAELYEEAHRYSDAVATYQRSLKLNPSQTSIFYRITRILIRLHQEDTTKPFLSEAERWAAKYGSLFRPSLSTSPHCCIA